MEQNRSVNSRISVLCIIALISAVLVAVTTGVTYARYRASKKVSLNYRSASQGVWMYSDTNGFTEPSGWTSAPDGSGDYTLSFVLSNERAANSPVAFDQHATIEVFVTEGVEFAENASVSLYVNGVAYEGVPQSAAPGSAIYQTYGEGRIYGFETGGETLSLFFEGGVETFIPATLTVSGTYGYPAAVTVLLNCRPD